MEALLIAGFILSVLALVATFGLVAVGAYVLYKYVALPWKVMRTDMTALNRKVQEIEATFQRSQAAKSEEEIARVEARLRARERARMEGLR